MTTATIPQSVTLPKVGPSADPAYQHEGALGQHIARFGVTATDTRVGLQLATGERFGYVFSGFVPTARTVVGSAVSLRMLGTTLTFKLSGGQVKERIRWNTLADATARLPIGLLTQGCHFEQGPNGALVVWSDSSRSVVATIPAPTIVDANGRSDGAIRYDLAADGSAVTLVIDPAWLATAAFPVFVDPTTITTTNVSSSSLLQVTSAHIFRMSDARLVAVWRDTTANTVLRSTSVDSGVTWTAPATIFTGSGLQIASGIAWMAATNSGDTIYGAIALNSTTTFLAFKMAYAAGAFTDTSATLTITTTLSAQYGQASIRYDAVKATAHLAFGGRRSVDAIDGGVVVGISNLLAVQGQTFLVAGIWLNSAFDLAVDGALTPNVYIALYQSINPNVVLGVIPGTWSGTVYTFSAIETSPATDLVSSSPLACVLDQSNNLDCFYINNSAGTFNLKTIKRTGVNTYGAAAIIWQGLGGAAPFSIAPTGNANADLFVILRIFNFQTNGEIFALKRTAGSWAANLAAVASGFNTGWQSPSAISLIQADSKAHMLYLTGTTTLSLVYDGSLLNGSVPLAPINVAPTGNGVSTLTPTTSATYKNTATGDPMGKYRVLVTRVSDAVVMWDTGAAGTAYTGAAINDGGTFSIVYAGTALAFGTVYQLQFSFWDTIGNLAGPLSTAVTFTPNQAPVVAITGPTPFAAVPSSGPNVTWSYSQAAGHGQQSFRVVIKDVGNVNTIYDSQVQTSGANLWTLPIGTLVNNTTYQAAVTATSIDGISTTATQQLTTAFTPPPAAALSLISNATLSKTKVAAYLLNPAAGAPAPSTVNVLRALSGKTPLTALVADLVQPLSVTAPATATALTYRQCPNLGLARNLVTNGGTVNSHGWALHANASVVADSTSVTGWAVRLVASAAGQSSNQSFPVEAGKAYSFAAQIRTDGTVNTNFLINWLDGAGNNIGGVDGPFTTSATWVETSLANQIAPGNARSCLITITRNLAAGIVFTTAIRVMQQAGAPAAWTAAHQQFIQRGVSIQEAATNLLTNPDFQTAPVGTARAHADPLTNLNAFTVISGVPTIAANLISMPAGSALSYGPITNEWWDIPAGTRKRWLWQTSVVFDWFVRYIDASNWILVRADGATLYIIKNVAGVQTTVASQAAVLSTGSFYWFQPSIVGSTVTVGIYNDAAGAVSTQIGANLSGVVADAALAYGRMAMQVSGGATQVGGAFTDVLLVLMPGVPGWVPQPVTGVTSFFLSKQTKFSGTYAAGVYNKDVGGRGRWGQTFALASAQRTLSGRIKTSGTTAGNAILEWDGISPPGIAATSDWTAVSVTGTTAVSAVYGDLIGAGTAWFANFWLAQQAYDTGNADPSGLAYAVASRTASSLANPLPSTFNLADFARATVVRFDHASNRGGTRVLWSLYVDANNYLRLYVDAGGFITFLKVRAGTGLSSITDAAATAPAAGDTVSIGVRHSATVGLEMQISKNGAAPVTYTTATQEALIPITGTPTSYVGRDGVAGTELDGTVGMDRIMKNGLTAAQVSAIVSAPYGDPDDNTLALWAFEGQGYQVPVVDDRLIALGTSYDYRADSNSSGANAATATGQVFTGSTAAQTTSWWLRSQQDPTKDVTFYTLKQHKYKVLRPAQPVKPASGGLPSVIYTGAIEGISGQIEVLAAYTTAAQQAIMQQAFRTILGSNDTIYLQTPFGFLYKVRFTQGVELALHETFVDAILDVLEVL